MLTCVLSKANEKFMLTLTFLLWWLAACLASRPASSYWHQHFSQFLNLIWVRPVPQHVHSSLINTSCMLAMPVMYQQSVTGSIRNILNPLITVQSFPQKNTKASDCSMSKLLFILTVCSKGDSHYPNRAFTFEVIPKRCSAPRLSHKFATELSFPTSVGMLVGSQISRTQENSLSSKPRKGLISPRSG